MDEQRFAELFRSTSGRVRSFARRYGDAGFADDVVAEVFLIAWRRSDVLPDEPIGWLFVTAKNVIGNHLRHRVRKGLVGVDPEVLAALVAPEPSIDGGVVDRDVMIAALASLTALEREAVLLSAWDGLTPVQAAAVAGCSVRAFTVRLHRARQRLSNAFATESDDSDADSAALAAATPMPRLRSQHDR